MNRHSFNPSSSPSPDEDPCDLPRSLVLLFAASAGLSVANVYYAQPLLDSLSASFGIAQAAVGGVVSVTQLGCALALVLLVPLGDVRDRKRLMRAQALALVMALLVVGLAPTVPVLLLGMLAIGLLGTAMTQGLIAYAASAAPAHTQGRVVGSVQAGVFIGLLLARLLAGVISDVGGWRSVYLCAAMLMLVLTGALWQRLPQLPRAAQPALRYSALLTSMWALLRRDRVLRVRGTLALLMFAALNIFWSALVLPLSAPPHALSHTAIGAFGLVGVVGALAASRAGRWADRGFAQRVTMLALLTLVLAWWPLAALHQSWWALMLGIVLLDLGGQALHVTNQSLIFAAHPDSHSRVVALYMLFYAVGSGLGGMAATLSYAHAGWLGVCCVGAAVSALALLVGWATRPAACPRAISPCPQTLP